MEDWCCLYSQIPCSPPMPSELIIYFVMGTLIIPNKIGNQDIAKAFVNQCYYLLLTVHCVPSLIVNYGLIWRVAEISRISFSRYKFSLWNSGEIWDHWWKKLLPNKNCTFKPGVIISRFFCPCQNLSSLLLCLCFVKRKDVNLFLKIFFTGEV